MRKDSKAADRDRARDARRQGGEEYGRSPAMDVMPLVKRANAALKKRLRRDAARQGVEPVRRPRLGEAGS